jgi:hypothetical protein
MRGDVQQTMDTHFDKLSEPFTGKNTRQQTRLKTLAQ